MKKALVVVAVLGAVSACDKKKAAERAEKVAKQDDFWPDAPKTTSTNGTRTLAYKPENVKGYSLGVDAGTTPGAAASIKATMTLDLAFHPGPDPRTRGAQIKKLDLDMNGAGQIIRMHLDGDRMTVNDGSGPDMTFKRGDSGPIDVAAFMDKPFTNLTFTDKGSVEVSAVPDHPMIAFGGDLLDNALVLFPDLPATAVAPGHTWSVTRNVPVGSTAARVDVVYNFKYEGDGGCPSGSKACAHLTFTASSKNVTVTAENGLKATASYGFAGKVFFDTDKGVVDESRVRMDLDIDAQGMKLPMGGTFIIKPTAG